MSNSRRGEPVYGFAMDALGLSKAKFELVQRDPQMLAVIGQAATRLIALEKELEMEKARSAAYEARAIDAETDEVTGLPNRKTFLRLVRELPQDVNYLVAMMDMRGLKAVNDLIGHREGDLLLAGAARTVVQKGVRSESTVGRWGGDEFSMVVPLDEVSEGEAILARLYNLFGGNETAEVCDLGGGRAVYLSARFGHRIVRPYFYDNLVYELRQADIEMTKKANLENSRGSMPAMVSS